MGWLNSLKEAFRGNAYGGYMKSSSAKSPTANGAADGLMKSRPDHLLSNYEVLDNTDRLDHMFTLMRRFLYHAQDKKITGDDLPDYWRERGKTGPMRPYFFLKPFNKSGLLFERSETGWVISKAEKNSQNETFYRSAIPWDVVTIFAPREGKGSPRITSERLGLDKAGFAVYERALTEAMSAEWKGEAGAA